MLNQLFGSKTRVQVLGFLFQHPNQKVYPREVATAMETDAANTLREFRRLEHMGILQRFQKDGRSYYRLDTRFPHYNGLVEIFSHRETSQQLFPVIKREASRQSSLVHGRSWYHQRFDGCPLFLFHVGEAEITQEKRKPAGTEANIRVCFFDSGKADWYLDEEDIQRGSSVIIKIAKKDTEVSKKLLAAWQTDEYAFQRYVDEEFPKLTLSSLSKNALAKEWKHFYSLGKSRFTSSAIIDHFALGTDQIIRDRLRKEVFAAEAGKKLKETEFNDIFSVLTAPIHQSFINQAEIELLRIGMGKSRETLLQFSQRYSWLHNNYYESITLTPAYFQKELHAWKKSGKSLSHECASLEDTPKRNAERKRTMMKKFRISQGLRTLLTISEDFSWWQDERKRATYRNIQVGSIFLKEVARRTGYTVEELKYCVASEIISVLEKKLPSRKDLRSRVKGCVVLATREGYTIHTGKDIQLIRKSMFLDQQLDSVQDVRGLSACVGRAVGTVKVVLSATEIAKVQKGDILISVMTRPDYITAMRKAAAIVTNEGGITSHAAIVSRELGIPCIIGTKIATEVFHDGDLVEVNANHGWIRKVQS